MLAVVARPVTKAALVSLTEQGVKRLVLAGTEHDARHAESNHLLETLNRIGRLCCRFEELWRGRPKINNSLNRAASLKDFDGE